MFSARQAFSEIKVTFAPKESRPAAGRTPLSLMDKTLELGTKPVGRLLLQYALPAIVAMTATSLYNMVDSIFIGQGVGAMAISGLAITFPFMNLSAAFGAAIGIGSASLLSVKLGQKDYKVAERIFGCSITLNILVGAVFALVSLAALDPILYFFGASDSTIGYARDYMVVILLGNIISHLYLGTNAILRAVGRPRTAMQTTIFTVVVNTILDPIFIYPLGLGIRGAAYATILSQLLALIWQTRIFSRPDEILRLRRGIYALQARIVKNITAIGLSPFLINVCACIVVIFINNSLAHYGGDLAVGAYGIANRIAFVFVMVAFGVCQGMQPIVGYNYGARHYDRMTRTLRLAIISATCITTAGFLISQLMPGWCARLFTSDSELIAASVRGIRLNMMCFPLIGSQIVVTNFFQSIGKASISIFLSLSRQMLALVPLLLLLPLIWGIDGVWIALPASDAIACIATIAVWLWYSKREQRKAQSPTT